MGAARTLLLQATLTKASTDTESLGGGESTDGRMEACMKETSRKE